MGRELPILFNMEMVRAITDGRKTVTRRLIKHKHDNTEIQWKPPCKKGDLLYIRETWAFQYCIDCIEGENSYCGRMPDHYEDKDYTGDGCYLYRADYGARQAERITWRPSIHMPKAAARIWMKVTDVRAQRLSEMTLEDFLLEGVTVRPESYNDPANVYLQARSEFSRIWDATLKKEEIACYGWDADPWVWVIRFERCDMF